MFSPSPDIDPDEEIFPHSFCMWTAGLLAADHELQGISRLGDHLWLYVFEQDHHILHVFGSPAGVAQAFLLLRLVHPLVQATDLLTDVRQLFRVIAQCPPA